MLGELFFGKAFFVDCPVGMVWWLGGEGGFVDGFIEDGF